MNDAQEDGFGPQAMSLSAADDERLIQLTAGGDANALEALYDRYAAMVMGLALKITGERATAEEVVQETFWRVWRNAAAFQRERGKLAGWLFGIARNLCIDQLRRRQVRPQPTQTEAEARQMDAVPDPAAPVADTTLAAIQFQRTRAAVAAAVSALPPAQRQVIELAYFGGLTRQEIAQTTGEPLGTVHTRARLALLKLRETLKDLDD